ncbi:hypothetical protein CIG75_04960 [Tumebacillus algifaecis]|uniref:NIPSNAP domain-containing protein n=1 Tax=Tumebacillus algifaecis TaxID=1214604 RepID=A0A223CZ94_9BACL|nr:hypothetical protein CIG75_04960 [Tumebacillus algifaecis]
MAVRGFFEYKITEGKRTDYLELIAKLRVKRTEAGFTHYSVSEGIDQKNLVVETFLVPSIEEYRELEAKLLEDPESALYIRSLDTCIDGGMGARKVWFFAELDFFA